MYFLYEEGFCFHSFIEQGVVSDEELIPILNRALFIPFVWLFMGEGGSFIIFS